MKTEYVIKTIFKDSIIYLHSKPDTLRCIQYEDNYLTFAGCQSKGIFTGYIQSRDSIVTVAHRLPCKFLFIRWGTKAIRQEVVSKNPHSQITWSEYIELKKR